MAEFRSGGSSSANVTGAEIDASDAGIALLSSGNALPQPTVIGNGGRKPPTEIIDDDAGSSVETGGTFDPTTDGIDFYESLEDMRVRLNNAVATSRRSDFPSSGTSELTVVGDGGTLATVRTPSGGVIVRCLSSIQGDTSQAGAGRSGRRRSALRVSSDQSDRRCRRRRARWQHPRRLLLQSGSG